MKVYIVIRDDLEAESYTVEKVLANEKEAEDLCAEKNKGDNALWQYTDHDVE